MNSEEFQNQLPKLEKADLDAVWVETGKLLETEGYIQVANPTPDGIASVRFTPKGIVAAYYVLHTLTEFYEQLDMTMESIYLSRSAEAIKNHAYTGAAMLKAGLTNDDLDRMLDQDE